MFRKILFSFLIITASAFLFSCASNGVKCAGKTAKYKHKKYNVKKPKRSKRSAAYASSSSSSGSNKQAEAPSPSPTPKEEQPIQQAEQKEPTTTDGREESANQNIPDLKTSGPPVEDDVIEFRGQDIVLTEEEGFQFEENIEFIDLSDLFSDRSDALSSLKDLSQLLKEDASIQVTIVGNTATTRPKGDVLYGSEPEVLRQNAILNADSVQLREVMVARAKRVYNLLIDEGVPANQLEYTTGSHRQWAHQRVVSFILRRKEN